MNLFQSIGQGLQSLWHNSAPSSSQRQGAAQPSSPAAPKTSPVPVPRPRPELTPKDENQTVARQSGHSPTSVSFVDSASLTPTNQLGNIDSRAVFSDSNAATAEEIDAVLSHYGSPHAGKGAELVTVCKEKGINPILMLAVMQQESSFGNKANNHSLSAENIANPWSVHFNESAKGIKKLRLKDGSMPTFEQSLRGAIDTLQRLSGDSSSPLSTAGTRYSETGSWTTSVTAHYQTQLRRIAKMR